MCNFGEHLTIDGYGGDFHRLNDKDRVHGCLEELPNLLKMNKLCNPHVYHAEDTQIKDPGRWSGFVIIAESHISIHTFPARRFVSADVYTCKNRTDTDLIISYFILLRDVVTYVAFRLFHCSSPRVLRSIASVRSKFACPVAVMPACPASFPFVMKDSRQAGMTEPKRM